MSFYRGMTCENVTINGDKGTPIAAYVAKPSGPGPFPGVVLVHHLPGWSELYIETTRRFAHHGNLAICANLYEREGGGNDANPDDVAAKVRADGGIADAQMVGDTGAVEMTKDLCCPLLGLFGNDDRAPSPEQVNQHEAELKKHAKTHEFHRYDGAGHGFFYWRRPLYRPEQAMEGWSKVFAFFAKHPAKLEARTCALPSSRLRARRVWRSAGTNGSRSRRRWLRMTTCAMRRLATSSRSTSSTPA